MIQHIYEYDNTYNIKIDKVLERLSAHCFYRCRICFNEWDKCYCYCANCRTYLRFCQQINYTKDSTYEDELKMIIALSG